MALKARARSSLPSAKANSRRPAQKRKLVELDGEMLRALTMLARDRMQDFQELADEAFRCLKSTAGP